MSVLQPDQEYAFIESAKSVRRRLADAVDLLLIHNERDVSGYQPRIALSPLTVLLAVSAWERLIADVRWLGDGRTWPGPEMAESMRGGAWANNAYPVLFSLTQGDLPKMFDIVVFNGYRGKRPGSPERVDGMSDVIEDHIATWIDTRNGVAHHCLPQKSRAWRSDAQGANGFTVQSGAARACTALMIQLVDQVISAVAETSGYSIPSGAKLPKWWFAADPPRAVRGVNDPGELWGGYDLATKK